MNRLTLVSILIVSSAAAPGPARDDTVPHIQGEWVTRVTRRRAIAVAGGPSWIIVGQDVIDDIQVVSAYPFDAASFASAVTTHRSNGRLGFNAGADATY